jgi:uncharacterized protein (TIGR03437 family)
MSIQDGAAQTNPWPTTLGDINVTVNGTLAPIFRTLSAYGAIYFQVPYETPTSGTASYIVTQNSTGAVLAVGQFQMAQANPGFFTASANGLGPVAATDGSGNPITAANPVARGSTVTFYLTGLGNVPGVPADGYAPTAAANAPSAPFLVIAGVQATVSYSGPGAFAGGWQINATVPMAAAPNALNPVALTYLGIRSNIGGFTNPDGSPGPDVIPISTTLYVK